MLKNPLYPVENVDFNGLDLIKPRKLGKDYLNETCHTTDTQFQIGILWEKCDLIIAPFGQGVIQESNEGSRISHNTRKQVWNHHSTSECVEDVVRSQVKKVVMIMCTSSSLETI